MISNQSRVISNLEIVNVQLEHSQSRTFQKHTGLGNQQGLALGEILLHSHIQGLRVTVKNDPFFGTGNGRIQQVMAEHPIHTLGNGEQNGVILAAL